MSTNLGYKSVQQSETEILLFNELGRLSIEFNLLLKLVDIFLAKHASLNSTLLINISITYQYQNIIHKLYHLPNL